MSVLDHRLQNVNECTASWTDLLGWQPEGECQRPETSLYFKSDSTSHQKWAKRICRGCPVRAQCLQWSLERPEDSGVWGGLTARERRAVAAIAPDGSWRDSISRRPWCPMCRSKDLSVPSERRLQCNEPDCGFNWPGLLPSETTLHPSYRAETAKMPDPMT